MRCWNLKRGAETLGSLELKEIDQPWFVCSFVPAATFEKVAWLFEVEREIADPAEWDKAYLKIVELDLRLEPINPKENAIEEFILHVKDGEAWFRY